MAGVGPVSLQMWQGVVPVSLQMRCGSVKTSPTALGSGSLSEVSVRLSPSRPCSAFRFAATSAPRLGSPLPHLHRDWAYPAACAPRMGSPPAHTHTSRCAHARAALALRDRHAPTLDRAAIATTEHSADRRAYTVADGRRSGRRGCTAAHCRRRPLVR